MTIQQAIDAAIRLRDGEVPIGMMIKWLSDHDGAVAETVIRQYEPDAEIPVYGENTDREATELLIPAPWDGLYPLYLTMMTDIYSGDIERYNNEAILYEAKRRDWANHYNATHRHRARGDCRDGGLNLRF